MKIRALLAAVCAWLVLTSAYAREWPPAKPQVENLGRGVIALRTGPSSVYVGWRMLASDRYEASFDVYRSSNGGAPVRLNERRIWDTSDFIDLTADPTVTNVYFVKPWMFGAQMPDSASFTLPANSPVQGYLNVPLQRPAGGNVEVPPGGQVQAFTYSPNDASVG